jgi:enoyl-CoA hydratase/carnithine racemase
VLSEDGATATVTLNQPGIRNAQNPLTWAWLLRCINDLPGTVRVLLLRGEGPSFSAGLDRRLLTAEGVHGATRPLELAAMSP